MKVSELTGIALDWAVAICELKQHLASLGKTPNHEQCDSTALSKIRLGMGYSTNWALGGPIIERELVTVGPNPFGPGFAANKKDIDMYGPTPLIAAMRCYVTSKLGDDIEIPEELL